MKEVKRIDLNLENCQIITVDKKYIGEFLCDGIRTSIQRMACNLIGQTISCSTFCISIHHDFTSSKVQWVFGESNETHNPIKRIAAAPDIVSVTVYFEDDEANPVEIFVPWNDDDDNDNRYQKSYINEQGDLFVVISEKLEIEDVFNMAEINNPEYMEFAWKMYR